MKLVFHEALITSVTNRGENHGEEVVPAHTVAFRAQVPLGTLRSLSPNLKGMLFTEEREPIPREPGLGECRWKFEYEGARLEIAGAEFFDVGLRGLTIEPEAAGVATIAGKINVKAGDEETSGMLARLVKQKVKISLEKLTQKTIEEAEEEADESQGNLLGSEKITADGEPIVPLQH